MILIPLNLFLPSFFFKAILHCDYTWFSHGFMALVFISTIMSSCWSYDGYQLQLQFFFYNSKYLLHDLFLGYVCFYILKVFLKNYF